MFDAKVKWESVESVDSEGADVIRVAGQAEDPKSNTLNGGLEGAVVQDSWHYPISVTAPYAWRVIARHDSILDDDDVDDLYCNSD